MAAIQVQTLHTIEARVAEHPWAAVALAFGAGVFLALAERSRSFVMRSLAASLEGAVFDAVRTAAAAPARASA